MTRETDRPSRVDRRVTVTLARSDKTSTGVIEVGVVEPAVILDVLLAVQRIDPTLGFRYSCRVAMCGTCAVRVDGRPVLACQTRVPQADKLVIEPLAGLPVVRDLIVDSTPFWSRLATHGTVVHSP